MDLEGIIAKVDAGQYLQKEEARALVAALRGEGVFEEHEPELEGNAVFLVRRCRFCGAEKREFGGICTVAIDGE